MKKFSHKKEFLHYLKEIRGYSELTVKSYADTLNEAQKFVELFDEEGKITFNLMPYRLHIAQLNPKTISKKMSALRTYTTYLEEHHYSVALLADESVKVPKTLPKPIPHKRIVEALEYAPLDEALVVVMLYTLGLRISELHSLKLEDIKDEWIRVMGKGSKQRDVPLIESTRKMIEVYKEQNMPKVFLFEKDGEKLSENSLRYIVTKVFKRVALKVTPHQLRHSYATSLLNNNARISDVSELLGHASMATTQIYTKLGSVLKQQNYSKAHPLCQGDKSAR